MKIEITVGSITIRTDDPATAVAVVRAMDTVGKPAEPKPEPVAVVAPRPAAKVAPAPDHYVLPPIEALRPKAPVQRAKPVVLVSTYSESDEEWAALLKQNGEAPSGAIVRCRFRFCTALFKKRKATHYYHTGECHIRDERQTRDPFAPIIHYDRPKTEQITCIVCKSPRMVAKGRERVARFCSQRCTDAWHEMDAATRPTPNPQS